MVSNQRFNNREISCFFNVLYSRVRIWCPYWWPVD